MFACTYVYMSIWAYTGEVNAKRIRERYFHAILRQDVAYFDNVGAGEITTRIQADTRKKSSLDAHVRLSFLIASGRSCTTGYIGEDPSCGVLPCGIHFWLHPGLHTLLATRSCHVFYSPVCRRCDGYFWSVRREVHTDVSSVRRGERHCR